MALLHAGADETASTDDRETPLDILQLESWSGCTMRTEWVVMIRARHHRDVEVWETLCGQRLLNKDCRNNKMWPLWQAPWSGKLSFLEAVMWSREQESGIFLNIVLFLY